MEENNARGEERKGERMRKGGDVKSVLMFSIQHQIGNSTHAISIWFDLPICSSTILLLSEGLADLENKLGEEIVFRLRWHPAYALFVDVVYEVITQPNYERTWAP